MEGSKIVAGHAFDKMQLLAEQLPNYQHKFEAYPIKRAWHLIRDTTSVDTTYCFIGAAYREARKAWGVYTQPTSVELPILIVSRTGELSKFAKQNKVSLKTLLNNGFTTIQYESVSNSFSKILTNLNVEKDSVLYVSGVSSDLIAHTVSMVESKRVDLGYVSYRHAKKANLYDNPKLQLFNVIESEYLVRKSDRILCSRTKLGYQVVLDIDGAITKIQTTETLRQFWIDTLFKEEGYPDAMYEKFQQTWNNQYPIH